MKTILEFLDFVRRRGGKLTLHPDSGSSLNDYALGCASTGRVTLWVSPEGDYVASLEPLGSPWEPVTPAEWERMIL